MEFKVVYCITPWFGSYVDIGTEWNLKVHELEIQAITQGRYRNRVEFKDVVEGEVEQDNQVDIGTEWNLKISIRPGASVLIIVDIGTEWSPKCLIISSLWRLDKMFKIAKGKMNPKTAIQ